MFEMGIEKMLQLALELLCIATAGKQNLLPRFFEQQGIEYMLGSEILMATTLCFAHREGKSDLDILTEHNTCRF
jgi:hypothetical protein